MKKACLGLVFLFTGIYYSAAQQVRPGTSAAIYGELQTLKNLPRVMYLAAHPDDENTGLLSWLVNGMHVEIAYLSLTRGDGGQNLLGKEQGAALGLIRTHELLEARRMDGAGQYFTRAIDFGFSKNTEDTFKQWDADSIAADVVWAIRKFRPDVIICRFPPTAAAGHGQHSGSAAIAEIAFKAAGDPTKFPNQLKHVSVWQPKRLLWNVFRFSGDGGDNYLKVTTGNYDPHLGLGYGELAGISRSLHKSQGAGTPSTPGIRTEYFAHVAGEKATTTLFDGIADWKTTGHPQIASAIEKLIEAYSFVKPAQSLPGLLALRKELRKLKPSPIVKEKLAATDRLILEVAGFMGEAVTSVAEAVTGDALTFRLNVISRSSSSVTITALRWPDGIQHLSRALPPDSLVSLTKSLTVPKNTPLSEPYWLSAPAKNAAQFSVSADTIIGLPERPPFLNVGVRMNIDGELFWVDLPLSYKKLDPVKGDVIEPLRIVPAVNIRFTEPFYFLASGNDLRVTVNFRSAKPLKNGNLTLSANGTTIETIATDFKNEKDISVIYLLSQAKLAKLGNQFRLNATLNVEGEVYNKDQQIIQYPHLPVLQYFTPAAAAVIAGDIKSTAKKIGYMEGAGDLIPEFLTQAGIQVDRLTESDILNSAKLAGYDAVVTGVRVINTEKRIRNWQTALKEYVQNGGTLVMQYNTTQDMALQDFGIYPFTLSSQRVTEENSRVKFLNPDHRLLNYPNKITATDFEGWVQERGAYFPSAWDNRYEPLFEMNDTGEQPLRGATLTAKYGKGNFIYTPLAFFRQLPAGNAGAARLFLNFISAGR